MAEIRLNDVRFSYVKVLKPEAFPGSEKKRFGVQVLVPKTDPQVKAIKAAINEVAKEEWKDKAASVLKSLDRDKVFFRDGDLSVDKEGNVLDGYAGCYVLSCNSPEEQPPKVFVRGVQGVITAEHASKYDGLPYSGGYGSVLLSVYTRDRGPIRGVFAGLNGIVLTRDGAPLGGGAPSVEKVRNAFADVLEQDPAEILGGGDTGLSDDEQAELADLLG